MQKEKKNQKQFYSSPVKIERVSNKIKMLIENKNCGWLKNNQNCGDFSYYGWRCDINSVHIDIAGRFSAFYLLIIPIQCSLR